MNIELNKFQYNYMSNYDLALEEEKQVYCAEICEINKNLHLDNHKM
jgi:hypothetical protein